MGAAPEPTPGRRLSGARAAMALFIARRLLWTLVLLVAISAITFLLFHLLPAADPAVARAGRQPTPEQVAAIREQLGLDRPWYVQLGDYVRGVFLEFDLGHSFINEAPVGELVADRLPNTLALIAGAAVVWLLAALVVGTVSATRPGSRADRLLMLGALVAISAPVYWLGLVSLYLFSSDLGVLPLLPGSGAYDTADGVLEKAGALVLPWIVLATSFAAIYARLLRSGLREALSEDYVRTARAKGLSERRVVLAHALPAAVTPLVTVLGMDLGILVGGAILTETVFGIDGIGRLAFEAVQRGDLATIQGTTLVLAAAVALMNLVVDLLYAVIDPRVRR